VLAASITCFSVFDCHAAADLNGVVKRNQMGGESMSMVEISASRGANPTATDSSGRFKLAFPKLDPDDRVDVDARSKGWVVVNYEQLAGLNLPKEAGANPLIIILAQEAEREQWRMAFYRIKGIENVTQSYQRKLANLEKTGTATRQERDALARERDQALAMVDALAKQFATVKPGDGDALYRQATQLFLNSQLDQALSLLNEKKLQDSADQAMKMEEDARRIKEETARNYRLRGQFLALRFQFADAAKAYGAATNLLPNDFENWFGFAVFHQKLNHFPEARQGYEKALDIVRTLPDMYRPDVAKTLNNLAVLHRDQNRYAEARKAYEEALGIFREFAVRNPERYAPDVRKVQANLDQLPK